MTTILDDLLSLRYPSLKYIHVFDGILRCAEELEQANQKDIADLMRSRVEALVREPDRCAKAVENYVSVSAAVNQLENWIRAYYRGSEARDC